MLTLSQTSFRDFNEMGCLMSLNLNYLHSYLDSPLPLHPPPPPDPEALELSVMSMENIFNKSSRPPNADIKASVIQLYQQITARLLQREADIM